MKTFDIKKFLFYLLFPLIMGGLVGFALKDSFSYLEEVKRTIIVPPIVFPIVWSILYLLSGLWSYFYQRDYQEDQRTITLYFISILVNLLFTPLLFLFHQHALALIDTLVLLVLILYLWIITLRKKKIYNLCLVPYVVWLIAATILMIDILIQN